MQWSYESMENCNITYLLYLSVKGVEVSSLQHPGVPEENNPYYPVTKDNGKQCRIC